MDDVRALARSRRTACSQLVRFVLAREISEDAASSGAVPDESAIREMATLIAVELVLKLQEASTPGGVTLSRRLVEDAARAAIERLELVEQKLFKEREG